MSGAKRAAPEDAEFGSFGEFYSNSAYAEFDQEHRSSGSFGQTLITARQGPIDLVDAAVPDAVFQFVDYLGQGNAMVDTGAKRQEYRTEGPIAGLQPAFCEGRYAIDVPNDLTVIAVSQAILGPLLQRHSLSSEAHLYLAETFIPLTADIRHLLQSWRTLDAGNAGPNSLLADGLLLQMLARLCHSPGLSPLGDARPNARIARAVDYAEAHLGRDLSVGELAGIAAMSPAHFARSFKASTGEAVWAFVQRRRAERARDLLLATRESLAEIAYLCGYSSQAHMTTALGARFGATPGAMRGAGR